MNNNYQQDDIVMVETELFALEMYCIEHERQEDLDSFLSDEILLSEDELLTIQRRGNEVHF